MKSVLTIRLDEKQAELIERLKKKTGQDAASKALLNSADIVCNEVPFLKARLSENQYNANMWK